MNDWLRGRSPILVGLVGFALIGLVVLFSAVGPGLFFVARTDDYTAEFANASGLKPDDPVYVAGVPAGRVRSIDLAGDRVDVGFRLDAGQRLGSATRASVKMLTVLGRRYLAVEPAGAGEPDDGRIPLARTTVPYILDDLGRQGTQVAGELDLPRLRQSLQAATQALPRDPGVVGDALQGVTAAAGMVNDHGQQLTALLDGSKQLAGNLLQQRDTLVGLLGDGDLLARTVMQRRDTIRAVITDVDRLTGFAASFLKGNAGELDEVLGKLHGIVGTLGANERQLTDIVARLGPTARSVANIGGNGPWGDVSGPAGPLPDNLLCTVGVMGPCR